MSEGQIIRPLSRSLKVSTENLCGLRLIAFLFGLCLVIILLMLDLSTVKSLLYQIGVAEFPLPGELVGGLLHFLEGHDDCV